MDHDIINFPFPANNFLRILYVFTLTFLLDETLVYDIRDLQPGVFHHFKAVDLAKMVGWIAAAEGGHRMF